VEIAAEQFGVVAAMEASGGNNSCRGEMVLHLIM